ncbi:MAG: UDP-N-acetylglucosamine 1-carboxyvinyltransferase [Alphaproteobacteria bacterium]|nr:UDP-N-acetylglucosamine 1-carboxyvinyltransferase [Alphaproteobacteria bacterium]
MQGMRIVGGTPLNGTVKISGAKNLALPALVATLLTDAKITFSNVPNLSDVNCILSLLESLGSKYENDTKGTITISTPTILSHIAPYDIVRKMRASILVLGPLLARNHAAKVSLPGGCAIGARGVEMHLEALKLMGVDIALNDGYIDASAKKGLFGANIKLPFPTVTGTENVLMAATLAKGKTRIQNAAKEPEISALIDLLTLMGAKIEGKGTSEIIVNGVDSLRGTCFEIMSDRIEAGTYAIAAAITKGKLFLEGARYCDLKIFLDTLQNSGLTVLENENGITIAGRDSIKPCSISTGPYPGFPTDLQAQYTSLMTVANGTSTITENIFENRFMHIPELLRLGANISIHGNTATVNGVKSLKGAQVMATDLRASVSLVLAGLAAQGTTIVNRLYHLDRGYEALETKLKLCGANIERFNI